MFLSVVLPTAGARDALPLSLFLPLQICTFRKRLGQRAGQHVDQRNLTCKCFSCIPVSKQEQKLLRCNTELVVLPCGCWKHSSLQVIASSLQKGEANGCVYKCHKNKPQDVFLFSPVILVFT